MSTSYTYIDKYSSKIFHRYVKNGEHFSEVVTNFPINLYLRKPGGEHKSIFEDELIEKTFDNMSEASDFLKKYEDVQGFEIFGNQDFVQQFIAHRYPGELVADAANFNIGSVDIEVEHDNGFPEAEDADNEILSIAIKKFGGESISIGTKSDPQYPGVRYIKCEDEIDLLEVFIKEFNKANLHILTGWNVYGYDVPYFVNRMNKLGVDPDQLSPFYGKSRGCITKCFNASSQDSYKILGLTVLDYIDLYKKFSQDKRESYKLDSIAQEEGVGQKITFEEYGNSLMRLYRENYKKFVEYNDVDNRLVELLDEKLKFIQLAIAISMLTKSRLSDSMGTVKIWDNLIYHRSLARGKIIPPMKRFSNSENAGGYVKETVPGRYRWPVTFDLTSLYPSIARLLNISPETMVSRASGGAELVDKTLNNEIRPEDFTSENICYAINGSTYRTDMVGAIPDAMTFVFFERKRYKDMMKAVKKDIERMKEELKTLES